MEFSFDVSTVVRPLRVSARRAIAVSTKLQRRAAKTAPAAVRARLAQLKASTRALDESFTRDLAAPARDPRPEAHAAIAAWGVVHTILSALTRLAADAPETVAAQGLLAALFPDGAGWLRLDHETVWVRGQHLLDALDRDDRDAALTSCVGAFVVAQARSAQHAFGVAAGLAGPSAAPAFDGTPTVDQRALLDAVTSDMAAYALQVVAAADVRDATSLREAAWALDPIVSCRARNRTGRAAAPVAEQPATPALPTVGASNDAARRVA